MSNYKIGDARNLYDVSTGVYVGALGLNGQEAIVPTFAAETGAPIVVPGSPVISAPYILAQSAVPVMIAQSGWVFANGTMVPGVNTPNPTVTLSATSGAGVTLTSSVAAFTGTASDVGKQITIYDNISLQFRSALITAAISTTQATVTLKSTFGGTTITPGSAGFFVGNPLPTNYTGGIWVYMPAGAAGAGLAGFYWCTAVNTATTDGMLQIQSAFQSSMGVPSIPTGFSNVAGPGAQITGVTTQQTLASVTVPGGAMGANGSLRGAVDIAGTPSSNNKVVQAIFAGSTLGSYTLNLAAAPVGAVSFKTSNRGAQNSQYATQRFIINNSEGSIGSTALRSSIDTSANQNIALTGQTTVATDYVILEGFTVEVLPRA